MTEEFRPIDMGDLPKLSREQLESPNVVAEAVHILALYLEQFDVCDDELLPHLPRHWRALYTTYWYEAQVFNGGHHQFFWNSEGSLNTETLQDLAFIGAEPFLRIFQDAVSIFQRHDYPKEKTEYGNDISFRRGYADKRFELLDHKFYKQGDQKSISEVLTEYIRRNANLYCG